jgi:beta-glucosidase
MNTHPFPQDFLFGCATASYQVEGAANLDGRGPSIWDTFAKKPGRTLADHNADVSVDQYHRYKEDVQLMKWLGLGAYRFSISWSRVLPNGTGKINEKGLDYYNRLVDELLANGIQPWITLFHWDLPQALEDRYGGWRSPQIADDFAEYAGVISDRLSDRVKDFFTINEFFCFIDKGYGQGHVFDSFAPGIKLAPKELNQTRHNALLAHGKAVQALRAHARQPLHVGLADNSTICVPVTETEENINAARKAFREQNAWLITPVMEGKYLDHSLEELGADAPVFTDEEMKVISSPLDFVGMNMYTPVLIRHADNKQGYEPVAFSASHPKFHMPWLNFGPQITYWAPRFAKELWNVEKFYITENGCAADDQMNFDGEILDTDRVTYLREHFSHAARAVAEGWPLKGYFVWSLLDNFEWAYGFTRRFGITYVNYSTLERTPKLSAHWYRDLIRNRRIV